MVLYSIVAEPAMHVSLKLVIATDSGNFFKKDSCAMLQSF
jgi:hypothetical protein